MERFVSSADTYRGDVAIADDVTLGVLRVWAACS